MKPKKIRVFICLLRPWMFCISSSMSLIAVLAKALWYSFMKKWAAPFREYALMKVGSSLEEKTRKDTIVAASSFDNDKSAKGCENS